MIFVEMFKPVETRFGFCLFVELIRCVTLIDEVGFATDDVDNADSDVVALNNAVSLLVDTIWWFINDESLDVDADAKPFVADVALFTDVFSIVIDPAEAFLFVLFALLVGGAYSCLFSATIFGAFEHLGICLLYCWNLYFNLPINKSYKNLN